MRTQKIVITGGPSTGKTAVIEQLEHLGYACLHEVIRLMTSQQKKELGDTVFKTNPIVSVADPQEFNRGILRARTAQYNSSADFGPDELVFFDRGIPDVLAYMDCFGQTYGPAFENAAVDHRYDHIFIMPPWKDIHTTDDERFETFEEGVRVYECLADAYTRLGYTIEIVPKMGIEERAAYILDSINRKT